MFARFKDFDGKNVAVIPYKVTAVFETVFQRTKEGTKEVESTNVTAISMDSGATFFVSDSERAVRSRLEKIANNGGIVPTQTGDEPAPEEPTA